LDSLGQAMITNPIQARDEMFELFDDAFRVHELVVDTDCEIRYQGVPEAAIPDGFFVRVSTTTTKTEQGGFADQEKRYDTYGNLFVQVFAPMAVADSYRNGELLAIAARDIFRGVETVSGVWFRNMRYVELDNDGKFYRWKVTVEFDFSER
jgi:hypothetical protein